MKAIILAAGYGTRLKPLSDHLPKPLMPILGKPVLWHIIRKLKASGISQIGINTHHQAAMVEKYLQSQDLGIQITVSHEPKILGVAGGIGAFRDFLQDEEYFLVHNGDIISNLPLETITDAYQEHKALITMALHNRAPFNNVSITARGEIIDIRDALKPLPETQKLAYTGIALMSTSLVSLIQQTGLSDLVPLCLQVISKGTEAIRGVVANGYEWTDLGTVASYFEAHRDILLHKKPLLGDYRIPGDGVFVADEAVVEAGVELKGFVSVGPGCHLKQGCLVENAVLWDDVIIEAGDRVANSIIGRNWSVNAG